MLSHAYGIGSRVVLAFGMSCLLIYLSLGYAWRVFACVFVLAFFVFFPPAPIRSGEAFSSVIFPLFSFLCFLDVAMVWKGKPASVTTCSRYRSYVRK